MYNFWQMFTTTLGTAAVMAGIAMVYFSSSKRSKLHKSNKTAHRILTAVLFGLLSIYASVSAIEIDGALCNCRNLAPLYAGLVGGPIPGIGAAIIGGLFRYFVYGGPAALPCLLACLFAGILGSVVHLVIKKEIRYNVVTGLICSLITEAVHLLLVTVFGLGDFALKIAIPVICSNALGMIFCLYIYKRFSHEEDSIE